MSKALDISLAWPTGNLKAYEQAVNAFPLVSEEEELSLARRYRQENDLTAAWHLVTSHLRFVLKIARSYKGYGLGLSDIIQEGNVGLMKAVKRFDPEVGVRLASYAVHHIRAEIHEYILKNWRMVKIATSKAQRKLFYRLRGAKHHLGWLTKDECEDIAEHLGVQPDEVMDMDLRLHSHDCTFEHTVHDEEGDYVPEAQLGDERFEPGAVVEQRDWEGQVGARLRTELDKLDERSRDILDQRWFAEHKATLSDLAEKYGVSMERVRQIEQSALKKLRAGLQDLSFDQAA